MTKFHPNTSRDHLLGGAPSIRSSRPTSIYSEASIDTLLTTSRLPSGAPQSYRGFESKEAYLTALQEWVDSKLYYETDKQLRGWYGTKTKEEYLAKTSVFEERRQRKRKEKAELERMQRRATVVRLGVVNEGEEVAEGEREEDVGREVEGKKETVSRLRRVFGRRNTVV